MTWLIFSYRNVFRNKRRSFMAMGMVAVAVMTLLLSGGFVLYTFDGLAEMTIRTGTGNAQIAYEKTFDGEPFSKDTNIPEPLLKELIGSLEENPMVDYSFSRTTLEGLVSNADLSHGAIIRGTDMQAEIRLSSVFSPIVRGYTPTGIDKDPFQAMVGERLAAALSLNLGDSLTILTSTLSGGINAVDVRVVAFLKTGIPDIDARMVVTSLPVADILLTGTAVQTQVVILKEMDDTDAFLHSFVPPKGLVLRSWVSLAPYYGQVKDIYITIFSFFLVMIGMMMLIALSNTMTMVVMERVREVGTMRSFGFSRARVRLNFLLEAMIMGIIGFGLGLLLSLLVGAVMNNYLQIMMPPPPGMTKGYPLAVYITPLLVGFVFVGMMIVIALSSVLPSRAATRMPIVDALGHI